MSFAWIKADHKGSATLKLLELHCEANMNSRNLRFCRQSFFCSR